MKKNILQNVVGFVFKYIWVFCALLVVLETVSVSYTAKILVEQTAVGTMEAVSGEISGRVDGVLRLITGMSKDPQFADTTTPIYDRVIKMRPYQESYNLFMIALTDEDVNVVSADEKEPPKTYSNLAYRDYMQRLYATGNTQITDVFVSGADHTTLNYTIAVPIIKDEAVAGSVFGSIYFEDIEELVMRSGQKKGRDSYLLSSENSLMTSSSKDEFGKNFSDMAKKTVFFDCSLNNIEMNMEKGKPGSCWEWTSKGLAYISYQRVEPTGWTLLYRMHFNTVLHTLLPVLCIKTGFYILLCGFIYLYGRRYVNRRLAEVNHLLNRMGEMQKELFQSEQTDYDNLLELTQKGLTDQLTGLSTRAVLFEKMAQITEAPNACGAVIFLDLDDLKRINDNFGHEGGDCSLLQFSKVLKEYEQKYGGLAARYGGDEFIFICNGVEEKAAIELAQNLCKDLNQTITTDNHTFEIHGSLGLSFYPQHGTRIEELICKADIALYMAKQKGKNQCSVYSGQNSML